MLVILSIKMCVIPKGDEVIEFAGREMPEQLVDT